LIHGGKMSLIALFLIIGGLGFAFLVLSLIVGDLFDAVGLDLDVNLDGNGDFGLLDSRVISIFLTAFGGFGAIGSSLGFAAPGALAAAVVGGALFGGLVFLFGRMLYRQQSSSSVTDGDLVGREAQVTVAIEEGKIGQIACRVGEERVEKIARAADGGPIAAGTIVGILSVAGDAVIVSAESGRTGSLFADKMLND
jgi:membrane protein implicated in regulation of membrane protease activity